MKKSTINKFLNDILHQAERHKHNVKTREYLLHDLRCIASKVTHFLADYNSEEK